MLDAEESIRAALLEAPAYMHVFYDLIKSSAVLAENWRVLADTTRALNTLAFCVDEVVQSQLSTRVDADLTVVHENVSRNIAATWDPPDCTA